MLKRGRRLQSASSSSARMSVDDCSVEAEGKEKDFPSDGKSEEELVPLRERAAWLSAQLASLESLIEHENEKEKGRSESGTCHEDEYEFEELTGSGAEGEEEAGVSAVVSEPDDNKKGDGAEAFAFGDVSFVDFKDEIEETLSRAATAQRVALAAGPLDIDESTIDAYDNQEGRQVEEAEEDSDDGNEGDGGYYKEDIIMTSVAPSATSREATLGYTEPNGDGINSAAVPEISTPPSTKPNSAMESLRPSTRQREEQRDARMQEAQRELQISLVSSRRKRSPLPVPGQDLMLQRMASGSEVGLIM